MSSLKVEYDEQDEFSSNCIKVENTEDNIDTLSIVEAVYVKTEIKKEYDEEYDEENLPLECEDEDGNILITEDSKNIPNILKDSSEDSSIHISELSSVNSEKNKYLNDEAHETMYSVCNDTALDSTLFCERSKDTDILECSECNIIFTEKIDFKTHLEDHCTNIKIPFKRDCTATKSFPCTICSRRFVKKENMLHHMQTHNIMVINKYKNQNLLSRQINMTRMNKRFSCKICRTEFTNQDFLLKHMVKHQMKYHCKECNARFLYLHLLFKHRAVHRKEIYKCDVCDKMFSCRSDVYQHVAEHNNMNLYECNLCQATFNTTSNLEQHQKDHANELFECDVCQKKFKLRNHLTVHKRMHSKVPFKCKICGTEFSSRPTLYNHIRDHIRKNRFPNI